MWKPAIGAVSRSGAGRVFGCLARRILVGGAEEMRAAAGLPGCPRMLPSA